MKLYFIEWILKNHWCYFLYVVVLIFSWNFVIILLKSIMCSWVILVIKGLAAGLWLTHVVPGCVFVPIAFFVGLNNYWNYIHLEFYIGYGRTFWDNFDKQQNGCWRHFRHWLYRNFPVPAVKISPTWRQYRFIDWWCNAVPVMLVKIKYLWYGKG